MTSRCSRSAIALLAAAAAVGCTTPAAPPIVELVGSSRRVAPIVPDERDHAAADLAVAVLAADPAQVDHALDALEQADRDDPTREEPTRLVPAGIEAANAVRAPGRAGIAATQQLLARNDLDAATRARLERWLADDPLKLASDRIYDARFIAVARLFNAVSEPVGRSFTNAVMLPYTLSLALAHYTIDLAREDPLPLQRRQALVQWERFRREYPSDENAFELAAQIEAYQQSWRKTQYGRALGLAEDALSDGRPDAALLYAARARRHIDSEDARKIASESEQQIEALRRAYANSLRFDPAAPLRPEERGAVMAALESGEGRDVASALVGAPESDAQRFIDASAAGRAGDDAAMWKTFAELAADTESPMARHAAAEITDPVHNPYAAFVHARSVERWHTTLWVLLGPLGARSKPGALGAIEYVLELPWRLQGAAMFPVRLIQSPWRDRTPGDAAIAVDARRYLELVPRGAHADEVRDWLEDFESDRENWVGALRVAEGRPDADDGELDALRERAAEQALNVASGEKRSDLRAGMLVNVARTFPETRAGGEAGRAARADAADHTTHAIRLSRGFLLENRDVAGAAGLDLAPELLDDDPRNGELHPDGVSLIGGNALAVSVLAASGDEDDPPERLAAHLSSERLAALVARLEETSFRNALLDSDDALEPDPQRDVVFERARLGIVDVDSRPEAQARYSYRGMRERYGMVRGREALLPVELVLQGSLSDLTLGAFPRLRPPRETPDAVLYR